MLHSSSLHYYACYCALICLLCQQHRHQQANAVTIIIDGASSSEWATGDEYQRLAGGDETSQQKLVGDVNGGGGSGRSLRDDGPTGGRFASASGAATANVALGPGRLGGDSRSLADLTDLLETSGAIQRRLVAADETDNSFRGQQQREQQHNHQLKPAQEFDLALDRLDLIERERQFEMARLSELNALEKTAESGVARALSHQAQATGAQINVADIPPDAYVAMAKANRRRKQRDVPKRRCGDDLTKALEFVCKHRFYNGDSQPEVVQPVIKSKRSVDNNQDQMTALLEHRGPTTVALRQQLRTLNQQQQQQQQQQLHDGSRKFEDYGDGEPERTSSLLSSLSLQHSSSQEPELSSSSVPLSSSSISLSSLSNNDGIDNTPHNHHRQRELQQQQQQSEYLSNYSVRDRAEEGEQGSNNLRGKMRSKKALMRRIRGASEECCERSCTFADMEAYCAAASSSSSSSQFQTTAA